MSADQRTCRITRQGSGYRLFSSARVHAPITRVFEFFSDAGNLDLLTPPYLRFEIQTRMPIAMEVGRLISYRLRLRGVPIRWLSEITAWNPPYRFVDEQRRGPYRSWRHEHRFVRVGQETEIIDVVDYEVPGGRLFHWLFVRGDLQRIFEYRCRRLHEYFLTPQASEAETLPRASLGTAS